MKTIVEIATGRVIAVSELDIPVLEGQVLIDDYPTEFFLTPYYNFTTSVFYEGATPEEVLEVERAEAEYNSQIAQEELVKQTTYNNVIAQYQQLPDNEAANEQAIYPLWNGVNIAYPLGYKVQSFNEGAELWLYKCVQPHTSQSTYEPYLTPALWTRVANDGEILAWEQPTGAQDAYNIGEKVYYPNVGDTIYESTVNANIYAPLVVPGQWVVV